MQVASTIDTIKKSTPVPRFVSLENYLKREEGSLHKNEYHNGQIIKMPGAKAKHNQIAMQIGAALVTVSEELSTVYLVYNSDMKIYIPAYNQAVYPDAVVVCEAPLYWNNREDIILNPILIVEVLSKSTKDSDRGDKFLKYKTIPSFKEYVLVSQDSCSIETWHREAPGLWRETITEGRDAKVHLASLGCEIAMSKVYRNVVFSK
jgi:Uma2 family endonuclease